MHNIHPDRIRRLNDKTPTDKGHVVYWMQQAQRAVDNHALEYAVHKANELDQRLLVVFGLMDDYPEANQRHYRFMLEGLQDTQSSLKKRSIQFAVRRGHPVDVALEASQTASVVVCDMGYLRHQREWRAHVATKAHCPVIQVESEVVVPVEITSDKAEYAARTIRPKIQKHVDSYLTKLKPAQLKKHSINLKGGVEIASLDGVLDELGTKDALPASERFEGGYTNARRRLEALLKKRLTRYADERNEPGGRVPSELSPYLHFGQISPLEIALDIQRYPHASRDSKAAFLEELIVRRELACNFTHFRDNYDEFNCLPDWARKTLEKHAGDEREFVYSFEEFERGKTHDLYWNTAMKEMRETGYMHNYMRMYWGKKILEWSRSPQDAFETALRLNNKHFLDGRDPNSYANVAWLFGLHDRPWRERPIFGTVRYMNAGGLERKFDMERYIELVDDLATESQREG